jgi:hypothetical protein
MLYKMCHRHTLQIWVLGHLIQFFVHLQKFGKLVESEKATDNSQLNNIFCFGFGF